jgi:predicted NAD/FAD-dependent oxidoreductase
MQIAIVGAGISGLTAARLLHDQGHRVVVFEKSRGPGGRAATRRMDDLEFDRGAQYFTARDAEFRRVVVAWREHGLVEIWQGRIGRVSRGRLEPSTGSQERIVGVPGMSAIGKHLAADLSVRAAIQVASPQRIEGRWRLRSATGEALGNFDLVILAVPAPQAQTLLLPSAPGFAAQAGAVVYSTAWALMLAFATDPSLPYDGLYLRWRRNPMGRAKQQQTRPAGPHLGRSCHTRMDARESREAPRASRRGPEIGPMRADGYQPGRRCRTSRAPLAVFAGRQATRSGCALGSRHWARCMRRLV